MIDTANRQSQVDYWAEVATHFDQNDWLANCAVTIEKDSPGRVGNGTLEYDVPVTSGAYRAAAGGPAGR